jgi:predicted HicB family RNase H-like nuclease
VSNHYTYRVSWSKDDGEHVATCAEFPSLSWLASDEIAALRGIKDMVRDVVEDMRANNEPLPEAIADRNFSGSLTLRLPPELHRRLALEAAEAHISLSRHLNCKLASA